MTKYNNDEIDHLTKDENTNNGASLELESEKIDNVENVTIISQFFSSEFLSMSIVFACVLVSDTARGILFPTLWLNVKRFGGNKIAQGMVIGAFSFGRIVSSPPLGWWCEVNGYRKVLIFCNMLVVIGCLMYSNSNSIYQLISSQFVIGLGAGSLGVSRSYVAEHSLLQHRTINLAYLTALQYMGFTVMPLLGAILSSWGHNNSLKLFDGFLDFDEFSLPALFMATLAILCSIFLMVVFTERFAPSRDETIEPVYLSIDENINDDTEGVLNKIKRFFGMHSSQLSLADKVLIGGCMLNIATKGTIGVFETLGSEFVISHFNWTSVKTGYTFSACGLVGVLFLLSFECLGKVVSDIDLIIYGICLMIISCSLLALSTFSNHSEIQFYISLVLMYSIGYPVGHTAVLGMYSKVIKSGPQGTIQGWFGSAGSFARIVFPLIAGILTEIFNDSAIFGVMGIILIISLATLIRLRSLIMEVVS